MQLRGLVGISDAERFVRRIDAVVAGVRMRLDMVVMVDGQVMQEAWAWVLK